MNRQELAQPKRDETCFEEMGQKNRLYNQAQESNSYLDCFSLIDLRQAHMKLDYYQATKYLSTWSRALGAGP